MSELTHYQLLVLNTHWSLMAADGYHCRGSSPHRRVDPHRRAQRAPCDR